MIDKCPVCKKDFEQNKVGDKIYCSSECRRQYHNRKRIGLPIDIITEVQRIKEKLPPKGINVECIVCHSVFIKDTYWQIYCSIKCRDIARRRRNRNLPLDSKSMFQKSPQERFWEKVDKNGPLPNHIPEIGNCWIWTGAISHGYGSFIESRKSGKIINGGGTHCYSYKTQIGPIPDRMKVCHKCDNRRCVRPDHLFLGTSQDNNRDYADKVIKMRNDIKPYNIENNKNIHLLTKEQLETMIKNCQKELNNRYISIENVL